MVKNKQYGEENPRMRELHRFLNNIQCIYTSPSLHNLFIKTQMQSWNTCMMLQIKAYFVKGYENIVLNLKILFSWTNRFSHNLQYSCLSIKSKINWQTTISDKYTYINISIFFLLLLECLCLKIPYPNF